jgi:hypothetical protein
MIADLFSEALIVATLGLVAMPLVARRVRTAFRPIELTRYNAATMSSGVTMLLVALVLCAAPVMIGLGGGTVLDRHFFPGDAIIGWISAISAVTLIVTMTVGYRRGRKVESRLRVEPSIGKHYPLGSFELVVLETEMLMAYAVGGRDAQVVVTAGFVDQLSVRELVSVVEHEAAHISLHHRLHLTFIGMFEPAAAWFRPARELVRVTHLAIERAADSCTTDHAATRRALLTLSGVSTAAGVAGFTAGDVIERLDALIDEPTPSPAPARTLMYASALALGGIALATLILFWL